MVAFLGSIYPFLCVIAPCVICQVILVGKGRRKVALGHLLWTYIFMIYVSMVFSVTGIASVWDLGKFGSLIRPGEMNLIPFRDGVDLSNILNVVMFMPLGFLIPFIWKKYRNVFRVALIGAWFSLAIELCQLFNRRATDMEDLITNTLGTVAGFCIWVVFARIALAGPDVADREKSARNMALSDHEPEIYLVLAVLGRFFLYNWRALLPLLE